MQQIMRSDDLERFFAPRWTWRIALFAGVISLGIYILLPCIERLSAPPDRKIAVRPVTTAVLPPLPPAPRVKQKTSGEKPRTPKPEMRQLRRRLEPIQAAMNLSMAMGNVGGDFSVDFGISSESLGEQVRQLIFDIGDLDEPPRPLAQLSPIYPPQARMRRIEGLVMAEFVVTAEGETRDIVAVSSQPGDIFVSSAIRAIERWRFAPGTKDGKPVATRVRQKVEFKLD